MKQLINTKFKRLIYERDFQLVVLICITNKIKFVGY